MDSQYIVAFKAGSSGRFVANLLWGLINPVHYEYKLSEYNSTHNFSPYSISFEIVKKSDRPFNEPDLYNNLKFTSSPAVAVTHVYPNFDVINDRFPNIKTIIIAIDKKDIPEIAGNSLLKNGFEQLQLLDYKSGHNHCTSFISNQYQLEFNEPYKGQEIPLYFQKELFKRYEQLFKLEVIASNFISPKIPNIDKTLIIDYHDLCHKQEFILKKLSEFTGKEINNRVIDLYQKYMEGREKLINSKMPWLYDK